MSPPRPGPPGRCPSHPLSHGRRAERRGDTIASAKCALKRQENPSQQPHTAGMREKKKEANPQHRERPGTRKKAPPQLGVHQGEREKKKGKKKREKKKKKKKRSAETEGRDVIVPGKSNPANIEMRPRLVAETVIKVQGPRLFLLLFLLVCIVLCCLGVSVRLHCRVPVVLHPGPSRGMCGCPLLRVSSYANCCSRKRLSMRRRWEPSGGGQG